MDFSSFLKLASRGASAGTGDEPRPSEAAAPETEPAPAPASSPSLEQRLAGGASKTASDALAAAVAVDRPAGAEAGDATAGRGRALDAGAPSLVVDQEQAQGGDASASQLEGTTITRYATELAPELPKLIAASAAYITYGLQKGHIRVLHRQTGRRALLKDHEAPLSDIRFASASSDDLASTCAGGRLVVRRLLLGPEEVQAQPLVSLQLLYGGEPVGTPRLAWQPGNADSLAVTAGPRALNFCVSVIASQLSPQLTPGGVVDASRSHIPSVFMAESPQGAAVTAVAISPDGLLACGTAAGEVKVVSTADPLTPETTVLAAVTAVSSLTWVGPDVLLVGANSNAQLTLWRCDTSPSLSLQQTLALRASQPLLASLEFVPAHLLVLLADARGSSVTALRLAPGGAGFASAAHFQVTMPIFSLEAQASRQNGGSPPAIQVFTVQSQAIQQYTLQPAACLPAPTPAPSSVAAVAASTAPPTPASSGRLFPTPSSDSASPARSLQAPPEAAAPALASSTATPAPTPASTAEAELPLPAAAPLLPPPPQPVLTRSSAPQPSTSQSVGSASPPLPTPGLQGASSLPKVVAEALSRPPPSLSEPGSREARRSSDPALWEPDNPSSPAAETVEAVRQALAGLQGGELGAAPQPRAQTAPASKAEEPPVASLTDLYERLAREQRRQAAQALQAQQALARSVREEVRRETKRLEAATEQQVARVLKAQLKAVAEERKALLEGERAKMERLLTTLSASINRDLPARLEELLARELQAVPQALGPALGQALRGELAGPALQASLEKSLAQPLQEGFRASFQQHVLPAFEAACRTMFSQVQATFAGGLAEHLQAAGGANAGVAAQLRESVGQADALASRLADELRQGCRQLLELASQRAAGGAAGAEVPTAPDPRTEVARLLEARRFDDAFSKALDLGDVSLVAWLCSQQEPAALLGARPPLLSQHVMLVLLQQLSYDLTLDTGVKLRWIKDLAVELDPQDPLLAPHLARVLQAALANLQRSPFEPQHLKAARFAAAVLESALQLTKPFPA